MGRVYLLAWFGLSLLGACSLDTVGTRAEPGNDASVGGSGNLGGVGASGGGFPDAATGGTAGTTGGTGGLAGSGGVGATGGSGGVDAGGGMGGVAGSGGAPVWKPSDIADCVLWLDGADDATIMKTGSSVLKWSDKCGGTSASAPSGSQAPLTLSPNGKQRLRCDGVDDQLLLAGPAVEASEYSLFFVVGKVFTGPEQRPFWSNRNETAVSGGTVTYVGFNSRTYVFQNTASPMTLVGNTGFLQPFDAKVYEFVADNSGKREVLLDGTVEVSVGSGPATATKLAVGTLCADLPGSVFGNYDLFEVIAYSKALNTNDRMTVRTELFKKWGL